MFIQLGIINYKLIIPFIYPIFFQIRFLIISSQNECFELFLNYLSYLLAGIIFLKVKYNINKSKKKNINYKQDSNTKLSEENIGINENNDLNNDVSNRESKVGKSNEEKKRSCRLKIFVISLTFINLIPMGLEIIAYRTLEDQIDYNFKESCSIFFVILFYVLFSRIILGHKIYNHQILALLIISVCMSFIFIIYIIENSFSMDIVISLIFFSLTFCLYALYDVLGKKLFDSFIISPYYFMFIIGFISLIILLPYEIITYLIDPNWKYNGIIRQIRDNFSLVFLLKLLSGILVGFLWLGGVWLTVYYFTPCHFIISESLAQLLTSLIQNRYKDYNLIEKIICYVSYGIIIFSSLIYNEIVIINNECISKDTKIYIIKRQENE